MIVRDLGDAWQIVLQPEHADLSGAFASAWGNERFDRPHPYEACVTAALRHDDGWAVWERHPAVTRENGRVRPRSFLDVDVASHLAFYRAMVASVREQDEYAGLLVSMHGTGIYNGRYGTNPELKLTLADRAQAEVDAFVAEGEAEQRAAAERLGVPDGERWVNYRLLQVYDRLSLHFCMRDVEREPAEIAPVPVTYAGEETALRLEPRGPWAVAADPFPFGESPAVFELVRRVLPKRPWRDADEFRRDFRAARPERLAVRISSS